MIWLKILLRKIKNLFNKKNKLLYFEQYDPYYNPEYISKEWRER